MIEELRASRERLVLAADAESHAIERALHDGVQQQLVVLAVGLQQMGVMVDSDSAAKPLLDEFARDLQDAVDVTARLAERIQPPLLEHGGRLPVVLRSAAVSAGVVASVEVETVRTSFPPEVARTVFLCWLEALVHRDAKPAISVHEEEEALVFEIVSHGATLDRLRDRIEALGGRLTVETTAGGMTQASGSLPLTRRP